MKDIISLQKKMIEKNKIEKKAKTKNLSELELKEKIIRILRKDIQGDATIYSGLTKIKGVSWSLSNAVCKKLKINKNKKIGLFDESEIKKIEEFLKNPEIPTFLKNRQKDFETGENKHLTESDLDLRKDFDIKRLKKIKSYKGIRHSVGLPVRGQRTKSNFRRNRKKGSGIRKKKNKNETKT
jgi:small subunit ribosomal protein S13